MKFRIFEVSDATGKINGDKINIICSCRDLAHAEDTIKQLREADPLSKDIDFGVLVTEIA